MGLLLLTAIVAFLKALQCATIPYLTLIYKYETPPNCFRDIPVFISVSYMLLISFELIFCCCIIDFYQPTLVAMDVPVLIHTISLIRLGVVLISQELSHLHRDMKPGLMCELREL